MSRRKRTEQRIINLAERIHNLERDIQFRDLDIKHLAEKVRELDTTLVEAGILEHEWVPEAPKGSTIKSNSPYSDKLTYTKVNKVWE